jgi:predicted 3-demethylubiquinone-9 3-methyltransferase (glyoxalase superfamily)
VTIRAAEKGDALTVDSPCWGIPCLGLNGGPTFKHSEAFSFQIATDNQEETDRYWNAIVGNGGKESQCGWCKDRWGLSWQITPRALTDALAAGGGEAKRAFEAMMPMKKIDIATIEKSAAGLTRTRAVSPGASERERQVHPDAGDAAKVVADGQPPQRDSSRCAVPRVGREAQSSFQLPTKHDRRMVLAFSARARHRRRPIA